MVADLDPSLKSMCVCVPVADIKAKPEKQAGLTSQLLLGDEVRLVECCGDFYAIQSIKDDYVGYIAATHLDKSKPELTHYVCVPRTFLYPKADMKLSAMAALSLGSKLMIVDFIETRGVRYGVLENGAAIFAHHVALHGSWVADYVRVAESLERTPYLWGGASAFGMDCSGLVQLAMGIAGQKVRRDSDMQCETIGEILPANVLLQRGDLVFWRGHVAIMCDDNTLIHANGASMDVRIEPYATAVMRIAESYGMPIAHRRPG